MELEKLNYTIRAAREDEWYDAMALAWKTFLKYEADDYSDVGIKSFREFITDNFLHKMFLKGKYLLFIAVKENTIIGLISLRDETHISLLFVDEVYHFQGIGRNLIQFLVNKVREKNVLALTVNASPYGVEFYHKVGFRDKEAQLEKDGIIYTPMMINL